MQLELPGLDFRSYRFLYRKVIPQEMCSMRLN